MIREEIASFKRIIDLLHRCLGLSFLRYFFLFDLSWYFRLRFVFASLYVLFYWCSRSLLVVFASWFSLHFFLGSCLLHPMFTLVIPFILNLIGCLGCVNHSSHVFIFQRIYNEVVVFLCISWINSFTKQRFELRIDMSQLKGLLRDDLALDPWPVVAHKLRIVVSEESLIYPNFIRWASVSFSLECRHHEPL